MPTPSEHKTVHPPSLKLRRTGARILAYAQEVRIRQGYGGQVGWVFVPREEAERRRGLRESGLSSPRHSGQHGGQVPSEATSACPPSLLATVLATKCRERRKTLPSYPNRILPFILPIWQVPATRTFSRTLCPDSRTQWGSQHESGHHVAIFPAWASEIRNRDTLSGFLSGLSFQPY
jgi:hypothetical protein